MLRGLKGEYKFGTVGEQLLPVSVGADYDAAEEWMKKAARLGIDVATDPFSLLTFGPGKKLVGAGLRGLSTVKKKAGLKLPQWMGIGLLPSVSVLRKYGGAGGNVAAKGIDRMYVKGSTWAADKEAGLKAVLEKFGFYTRKAETSRIAANDWIEMGASQLEHADPKIGAVATQIDEGLQGLGKYLTGFKDVEGKGFKVIHPGLDAAQKRIKMLTGKAGLGSTKSKKLRDEVWAGFLKGEKAEGWSPAANKLYGTLNKELKGYNYGTFDFADGPSIWQGKGFYERAFKMEKGYTPTMLKEEVIHMLGTEKGISKAAKELAKLNNISEIKAAEILRRFGSPAKAGNLEYAREFKLPGAWKETDPLKYLPRYYERAFNRIAFAKEFGLSGNKLDKLLGQAIKEGLDPKFAEDLANVAKGKVSRSILDRAARKVMAVQVITKMGPLSSLANLTQSMNTIVREGGINFTKGILRSTTTEGKRAGVVAYQRGIHDSLMRLAGGESTWANRYLEMVGFNPVERMNRLLAANAGIVSTEKMIGLSGKMTEDLARRGVSNDDILKTIANNGKLPQAVADRIGFLASEATQHATHWKDIPLWWQSPVWRTAFQYKSFIYQQSRFAMREIMNPAIKYFKTNGKKGSVAPLLRASALFGIGGTAVAEMRQSIRHHAGKLVGIDYEPPEFDEKHPVWELFQNSLYVGSLGMAGDLVDRAAQRDLKGWLLGPTVGDLSDLAEGGIAAARAAADEEQQVKWHRLFAELQRRAPVVGTVLPRGRETTKKWEDLLSGLR
jgi:hypothetical protein